MEKLAFQNGREMMYYAISYIEEDNYIFGKCKVKCSPYSRSIYCNGERLTNKIIWGISKKIKEIKQFRVLTQGRDGEEFQ